MTPQPDFDSWYATSFFQMTSPSSYLGPSSLSPFFFSLPGWGSSPQHLLELIVNSNDCTQGSSCWRRGMTTCVCILETGILEMNPRWCLDRRLPECAPIWWPFLELGTLCLAGSLRCPLRTQRASMPSPRLAGHWKCAQASKLDRISR